MNKALKTILIISIVIFGAGVLFIPSAQAGVVQFGDEDIFVDFDELPFNLSNWAPGMSDVKSITINNGEDFDINLYFKAQKTSGDEVLAEVLTITIDNKPKHLSDLFDDNITLTPVNSGESQNYNIAISFDSSAGNEYQGKTINFDFIITAEEIGKGNGEIPPVVIPGGGGGGLPPDLTIRDESVRVLMVTEDNITITWTTSYFSTSQVIYGAEEESHTLSLSDNTGTPPKYGYAHTTPESDISPKVTGHSVTITRLTPGTTYYYRCVSHASLAISQEHSFTTLGVKGEEEIPSEEITPSEEETPFEEGEIPEIIEEVLDKITEEGKEITEAEGLITELQEFLAEEEIITSEQEKLLAGNLGLLANMGIAWGEISQSLLTAILVTILLMVLLLILIKESRKWAEKRRKKY